MVFGGVVAGLGHRAEGCLYGVLGSAHEACLMVCIAGYLGGWARRRGLEVLGGAGFLAQGTISPDKHQQFELGCRNILELSRSIGDELYYVHSSQSNQKLCSLFMKTRR